MHRKFATFLLSLFLLMSAGALLSACNTVHGAGEDLEVASDKVKQKF
jgi:predicted small secreted protein